jgi:hypothetical protein
MGQITVPTLKEKCKIVQKITSIRYCRCGYPLNVAASFENGTQRREYIDKIFRCPNCGASLSEAEDRHRTTAGAG